MQAVLNGIQQILKKKLNINVPALSPKTDLKKDLELADWEMLYLLNAVENKWHVSLPNPETDHIGNVGQLMAAVQAQHIRVRR
jgi:acyl carrier protein